MHLLDNIVWHALSGPQSNAVSGGWKINAESTMFKLVWKGGMPLDDEAPDAIRLVDAHSERALALATLTKPGPFGPRTIELGEYFGLFVGDRLMAMVGERMGFVIHPESVVRVVSPA